MTHASTPAGTPQGMRIRAETAEAALKEMTRRRDAWRRKAAGYDELAAAVRKGVEDAGPRDLGRVFLRGALVAQERQIQTLTARADAAEAGLRGCKIALEQAWQSNRNRQTVLADQTRQIEDLQAIVARVAAGPAWGDSISRWCDQMMLDARAAVSASQPTAAPTSPPAES